MSTKHFAPMTLLLTPALAAGLYRSYMGISFESIGFPSFAGSRQSPNSFSYNLMTTLASMQDTPVVVRVGGNSADRIILDSTLTTPTASSCPNADPGAWQCIGTSYFDSYGAFPAGTLYSHDFNLATWNQSGFDTLTATVPLACNALRGQLDTWEMGNEPDLYIGSRRPSTYNAAQYSSEWVNATGRFETLLRNACPDMFDSVSYMAPSVSSPGSRLHASDIFADEGTGASKVTKVSAHNYMDGASNPGVTLQKTLMSQNKISSSIQGHVNYAATVPNVDYIIGEHNSLYGGGAAGLSDVFGAALWGFGFTLKAASTKVIKRVYFHQANGSPYAAWQPDGTIMTKAPYYGKLASATFLANSDTLDVNVLSLNGDADKDVGYSASVDGQVRNIALINFREFNSTSSQSSRPSQTYSVNVDAGSSWTAKRLTADGAHDKTGVTFNGYAYEASTNGQAARVSSRDSNQKITASSSGALKVTVKDSEAVVLVRDN